MAKAAIKLLIDEDVWQGIAEDLRKAGHDAVSVTGQGWKGLSDEDILAHAIHDNRALLTHNIQDFVPLAEACFFGDIAHPGIIVAGQFGKGEMLRRILTLLETLSPESLANTLRFL